MAYGLTLYDFVPERDLDPNNYKVWFCDVAHSYPVWSPFYAQLWMTTYNAIMAAAADKLSYPRGRGWHWRLHNGYGYATVVLAREEDVPAREDKFREVMAPIIDDPFKFVSDMRAEAQGWWPPLWALDVGKMSDWELHQHMLDCFVWWDRAMYSYFYGLYATCAGYILFRTMAQDLTGLSHTDELYEKLMGGFSNEALESNRELARLAGRAIELKLEDTLKLSDEQVLSAMEQSDAGRQWLKEFHEFLNVHGWRCIRLWDVNTPTWVEKPSVVVPTIREMLATKGVHGPEAERERHVRAREEATQEFLAKVPLDDKEWMGKLLVAAQAANTYEEDECYWRELVVAAILRRCLMELSGRLVKAGVMDDTEDIWMLMRDEIKLASTNMDKYDLRSTIKTRREEYESYRKLMPGTEEVPPGFGDFSQAPVLAGADPVLSISFAMPVASADEVGATCVGAAGARGMVEGVARVLMDPETEMHQLQPGEILVCPMTTVAVTPIFAIIKGAVTDSGGALSHPVIVGREYGVPTVAGCGDATKKIKTGQRVRVDGNLLRVYTLD